MDWSGIKTKLTEAFHKYKFVLIVLAAGLFFLLLPGERKNTEREVITPATDHILSVEEELSQILSMVRGAGEVKVMLTVSSGEETLYQTNSRHADGGDTSDSDYDTVTVTDANRNEYGLVRQIKSPIYSGAIVVCQGADDPAVRLHIVEAVSNITGLGADKISVLKMK